VVLADNSASDAYKKELESRGFRVIRCARREDPLDTITECRNKLREIALQEGFDYFLSLEQDVIPPSDVIERLLERRVPIVSGVYCTYMVREGKSVKLPLLWTWVSEGDLELMKQNAGNYPETLKRIQDAKPEDLKRQLRMEEVMFEDLLEVKYAGVGCMLIGRDVLERCRFVRSTGRSGTDDFGFCDEARNAGFKVFADCTVKCDHLKELGKLSRFGS
jgi:GT2 family glycosyltransferase